MCLLHRFFKLCRNTDELAHLPNSPKLVLATMPSLDVGLSRELFADWSQHPRNLVLFTQRAEVGAEASSLPALHLCGHTSPSCTAK